MYISGLFQLTTKIMDLLMLNWL